MRSKERKIKTREISISDGGKIQINAKIKIKTKMKIKAKRCNLDKKPTKQKIISPQKTQLHPTHPTKNQYLTTIIFSSNE